MYSMMGLFSTTFILVSLYLFFFTSYWWITAAYVAWYLYDLQTPETGGRDFE
jgi:hypothetical protein